jgi:hypothetical protein
MKPGLNTLRITRRRPWRRYLAAGLALGLLFAGFPGWSGGLARAAQPAGMARSDAVSNAAPVSRPRGLVQPVRAAAAVEPPVDPLITLLQQQPAIDTESPVVARAEFDPPVARAGGYMVYRVTLNAINDSVKLPEALPAPGGLTVNSPTRGQLLLPRADKLTPDTTINYPVNAASNGVYTMPSFELEVYGKKVRVPAASFQVVDRASARGREAMRLEIQGPTGNVYVGQAVRVRLVLADPNATQVVGYMQLQLSGELVMVDASLNRESRRMTVIDGKTINAFYSDNTVFPMKAGVLELRAQIHALVNRAAPGTEGALELGGILVDSAPLILNALPIPQQGRLRGFTGLVGEFQLEPPALAPGEVSAGDPVTLAVVVKGEGNFHYLAPPKPTGARDWQIQPPSLDANFIYYNATATAARRRFKYTLVPVSDRVTATPAIPFCYFNPQSRKFVDLTIPSVPVKVLPAPPGTVMPVVPPDEPEPGAVEPEEPALSAIVEALGAPAGSLRPLQQRPGFIALQLAFAAALAGVWGWHRRRAHLENHPEILARRAARRALQRRLAEIRAAAQARDAAAFAVHCADAFKEAAAPELDSAPQALVAADLLAGTAAVDPRGRASVLVREIFNAADSWRFARRAPPAEILERQAEVEGLIQDMLRRL